MNFTNKNLEYVCYLVLVLLIISFIINMCNRKNLPLENFENNSLVIKEKLVFDKYNELVSVLGKPTYLEKDSNNNMNSATWMSPLSNFTGFGKFGGADLIKITGHISKKYHPHPANLFIILGKYMSVPDHLIGPLKYASETINIEQLYVPIKDAEHYYNTGEKRIALVTGSCASVTISAITVQCVMDLIKKYKNYNFNTVNEDLYRTFRMEYDRRIDDYLCGRGITDPIPWFDHNFFKEGATANLGEEKCKKKIKKEAFSHYPECATLMKKPNFCELKENANHKCC